jgi:succinyl-CoA synthetase beta subunit
MLSKAVASNVGRMARGSSAPLALNQAQKRFLNLHEYQALEVFGKFGVAVPKNMVVKPGEDVGKVYDAMGTDVVVKTQVLAGGRGLGYIKENNFQGGVHVAKDRAHAVELGENMLGKTLVTKQTGEEGKPVNTLLLVEKFNIKSERYFAILMDRGSGGPLLIGSAIGGTSIEDIAAKDPSAIIKMPINIMRGMTEAQAKEMATKMAFTGAQTDEAAKSILNLYRVFVECDCTMVEINPFAELDDGRVIVCDAKVNFDDNAEFRHKDLHAQRDYTQEDPREVAAKKYDLNYIGLDGSIACMVNGAGLAMSTMDLLNLYGGTPANFLDVGGAANEESITAAFTILQGDPNVKSIFINIFGGIMKCDVIAGGVIAAIGNVGLTKPLVVRLVGTNVEQGKKLLNDSGLAIEAFDDFTEAAKKAVELGK